MCLDTYKTLFKGEESCLQDNPLFPHHFRGASFLSSAPESTLTATFFPAQALCKHRVKFCFLWMKKTCKTTCFMVHSSKSKLPDTSFELLLQVFALHQRMQMRHLSGWYHILLPDYLLVVGRGGPMKEMTWGRSKGENFHEFSFTLLHLFLLTALQKGIHILLLVRILINSVIYI